MPCLKRNSLEGRFVGNTYTWNPESRNGNGNGTRNQISTIEKTDFCTIQTEFVLVFLAVPLNLIFLLLCLDKVCRSVGYFTARPMKVILRVIFIHEFMG